MPYHLEHCVYDIEPYVDAVVEAKRRGHPVKLGIEVDYEPDREEETAAALHLSVGTIKQDWRLAKAWLARELDGPT